MAGNANLELHPASRAAPSGDFFRRQRFFSEMYSCGADGEGYIQAVVDEHTHAGPARLGNGKPRQFDELARLEVLFTNLNPVGAPGDRVSNGMTKQG